MKILITGGAGFIGSHLVEHFHEKAEVAVLDNFSTGNHTNLEGLKCEISARSILSRGSVRRAMEGVDYVFHLAGMVNVQDSILDPITCAEVNILGTLMALEEAAEAGVQKFIFSSSASVYGNSPTRSQSEESDLEPINPYAATKLAGEVYCRMMAVKRKVPTLCLRYFNVFGPRQWGRSRYSAVPMFIHSAIRNLGLKAYSGGKQVRDFIYVKEVVAATAYLALKPDALGTFNIGTGVSTTVKDLAETIIRLSGSTSQIENHGERVGDIEHSVAGIEKLKAAGYTPGRDMERDLKATIDWYLDRCLPE